MVHPYRQRNLMDLAHKLQFSFRETDEYGLLEQLGDFRLFQEGRKREITRILRQQDEMMAFDISIFDYTFQPWTSSSRSSTRYQTVFFLRSGQLGLPELQLQPETLAHKLGELLGMTDIDFVRYPKFSGQYRLTGTDEAYIRHHFTDEVLHYFTENKGWSMEGLGFYLIFYRKGVLIPSAEIEQFYLRGMQIFRLLTDQAAQQRHFGE